MAVRGRRKWNRPRAKVGKTKGRKQTKLGKAMEALGPVKIVPIDEAARAETQVVDDAYQWIKAIIDCGQLHWEYQVRGVAVQGRTDYGHEDVSDWSEDDIKKITRQMLDVPEDVNIQIEYR